MEILFLIVGLCLGFVISFLYFKSRSNQNNSSKELEEKIISLDKEKLVLQERFNHALETEKKLSEEFRLYKEVSIKELNEEREKLNVANGRLETSIEKFRNLNERLSEQKKETEELQKKLTSEFENIASKILEEKSKKFTDQNKSNLDIILNPLKEKIKEFEDKVDKTYKAESAERITLKAEIKNLVEMNKQISDEANNLAKALKGDNKKQGNWGEVILEKILERSGLVKDREYKTQVTSSNSDGTTIKPDVVIYLPDEKNIIIDSKVSLVAYEAFVNCDSEEDREKFKKEHLLSIKNHIKLLSDKNYQSAIDFNTPDFVLLFVPIESSFSIAIQADHDLFNYAWERKIVVVSPSTLLATLLTISSLWKQEKQTRNAIEIAEQSGRLYDKFVGFVEDMGKIGEKISLSQKQFDEAMKKLSTGTGNLINRAENIRKLGAKNTKAMPGKFIEIENENLIEDSQL